MLSYKASAQLDQLGPEKCSLRWEGRFELPENGQAADALGQFLSKSYKTMFKGIGQQLSMSVVPTPYRPGDG
jgi:hypothetical protein